MISTRLITPLLLATLFLTSGASCPHRHQIAEMRPLVFNGVPSLEEVIQKVNSQTSRIHSLQALDAKLSVPGLPGLRATVAFERPHRFRLRAETALTGPELDLGSNDNLFWLWAKRNEPPAVYFCDHNKFDHNNTRHIFPVDPIWLVSAMGIVYLDPSGRHSGPYTVHPGQLEIRSLKATPQGDLQKITILDDRTGWVLEQHLYDSQGQLLATTKTSQHQYDAVTDSSLPRHIEVQLPTAELTFAIDVSQFVVNSLQDDPMQLWTMPQPAGVPLKDLSTVLPTSPSTPQTLFLPKIFPKSTNYVQLSQVPRPRERVSTRRLRGF